MEGEKKEKERKKVRKREGKRRKRIQLLILFGIKRKLKENYLSNIFIF